MLAAIGTLMLSLLAGLPLVLRHGSPGTRLSAAGVVWGGSLALALGMALSSAACFAALCLGETGETKFLLAEGLAITIIWLICWPLIMQRGQASPAGGLPRAIPGAKAEWLAGLAAVVAVLLGAAVVAIYRHGASMPQGDWDASAIWNLRARWILGDPAHWMNAFTLVDRSSHTDYPLFLPLSVLRVWTYTEAQFIAGRFLGLAFFVILLGLMAGSLARLRGWAQALLAVTMLISLPQLLLNGANQLADLPLSMFMLAAAATAAEAVERPAGSGRLWLLCGLAAAAAAWTKNEGLLFAVCLGVGVLAAQGRPDRRLLRTLGMLALGAAPLAAALLAFKMRAPSNNDILAGLSLETVRERVLDGSRHRVIWEMFWRWLLSRPANFVVFLPLVYVPAAGFAGGGSRICRLLGVTLGLLLAGYYAVYLVTPLPLEWQVPLSLGRLISQIWPVAVLTTFLAARRRNFWRQPMSESRPGDPVSDPSNARAMPAWRGQVGVVLLAILAVWPAGAILSLIPDVIFPPKVTWAWFEEYRAKLENEFGPIREKLEPGTRVQYVCGPFYATHETPRQLDVQYVIAPVILDRDHPKHFILLDMHTDEALAKALPGYRARVVSHTGPGVALLEMEEGH